MKIIAHIHTDFPDKFGIPRQSGLVESLQGTIIFEPEYRNPEILRRLEEFSHIWLLWKFSKSKKEHWSATVKPPRLGGKKRVGVFATRSPFRPNDIGLSCVKLEKIELDEKVGPIILVSGVDLFDMTPIYDIKPYIPFTEVIFPQNLLERYPPEKREAVIGILAQDPRPTYVQDPNRIYGVAFAGFDIKFQVDKNRLTVCDVVR